MDSCTSELPERFDIPEGTEYLYMITQLAKYYSLPPCRAEKLDEMDFWVMREFESLDQQRTEYIMKQKFNRE